MAASVPKTVYGHPMVEDGLAILAKRKPASIRDYPEFDFEKYRLDFGKYRSAFAFSLGWSAIGKSVECPRWIKLSNSRRT
jgi:hypothetical protein